MIKSKNKITLLNITSTIILQGLAFLTGPIFAAKLGPNNYGIAAVYLTWVQFASIVLSLQAGSTIALARSNFSAEEQDSYQSSVLSFATIIYIGFTILILGVIVLLSKFIKLNILIIAIGLVHGWGMYCISFMNSKFTYEFKADKNFMLSISVAILTVLFSLFFISLCPKETNYWGRIIGQSCIYFIMGLLMFSIVLYNGKIIYSKKYWAFTLPIAVPIVFHLLANIVLNQSDKIMLQRLISNSAAGIYALAGMFSVVLNTIWSAFNNSWVPFYYEYTRKNQIKEIKIHSKNYIEIFTIITVGFILLSREVFHLYAKSSFWEGTDFIPLFAIGYYFVFLYSLPVNFEFYHKRTRTIAIGTSLAAFINIGLNIFMIKSWGIIGAVIATTISHGLQFIFHYICAKRIDAESFPFSLGRFMLSFLIVCLFYVVYLFTKEQWLIRWGIGVLIGVYELQKIYRRKEIF